MNTNYLSGVFTSHSVLKKMKERRKGHVVFVSSIGGQVCKLLVQFKVTVTNVYLQSCDCCCCFFFNDSFTFMLYSFSSLVFLGLLHMLHQSLL